VVSSGRYELQPVSVATVAAGFALALERPQTVGRGFEVCGPQRLPYVRILDIIAGALGRGRPKKLHLPVGLMRAAAGLLGRFSWFPLTSDQLTMLLEGNVCDPSAFEETFGLPQIPFEGSLGYLSGSRR
jgi:NADH dehydrogenase